MVVVVGQCKKSANCPVKQPVLRRFFAPGPLAGACGLRLCSAAARE